MGVRLLAGAVGGLAGGIVGAGLLSLVGIKGHHGDVVWAMTLVAHTVHSDSLAVGWLTAAASSTFVGVVFGILFGVWALRPESAAVSASLVAILWWIVDWFVVMSSPLRGAPWVALEDPSLFQIAVAGFLAHVAYGAVLAGVFTWLVRRLAAQQRRPQSLRRPAIDGRNA